MEHLLFTLLRDSLFPGRRLIAVEPVFAGLLITTSPKASDIVDMSVLVIDDRSNSGECGSRRRPKQSGPDIDLFK